MRISAARRRGFVPLAAQPPAAAVDVGGDGNGSGDAAGPRAAGLAVAVVPGAATAFKPLRAVPPHAVDVSVSTPAKPLPHTRMVVPPTAWPPA